MKPIFVSLVSIFLLLSCSGMSDAEKAAALVDSARSLVIAGQLNEAKIRLDSVHYSYPKCVAQRRLAKDLQDSVVFIEAQRTLSILTRYSLLFKHKQTPYSRSSRMKSKSNMKTMDAMCIGC